MMLAGLYKVLQLHLLELTRAEDEVARRDLVAKAASDLGDAEGQLLARGSEHILEVDEHALRRLGPQVGDAALVLHRPYVGAQHHVEHARLGELSHSATF